MSDITRQAWKHFRVWRTYADGSREDITPFVALFPEPNPDEETPEQWEKRRRQMLNDVADFLGYP